MNASTIRVESSRSIVLDPSILGSRIMPNPSFMQFSLNNVFILIRRLSYSLVSIIPAADVSEDVAESLVIILSQVFDLFFATPVVGIRFYLFQQFVV